MSTAFVNVNQGRICSSAWRTAAPFDQPRVHDLLGGAGRDCLVIGLPQTWPVQPMRGHLLSGPLTPGRGSACSWPAIFRQEALQFAPDYLFDVPDFRAWDKARLLQTLIDMAETQHRLLCHCLRTKALGLRAPRPHGAGSFAARFLERP